MSSSVRIIRTLLDKLYFLGGVLAALFLIAILVLILLQMLARWTGEVSPELRIMPVTAWLPHRSFLWHML